MMPSAPANRPPSVASLLAQAAASLRAGRPADAIAPLREASRSLPGDAAIAHDLGLACLECGRLAEAITALQGSIAADPRLADSHLRLGIALESAGAFDAALAAYRSATQVQPALADAHYRAGDLLDSLGRTGPAMESYRAAAAAAPQTTVGRIAAARALVAENRHDEAMRILRLALTLDPGNAVALDLLGNSLAETGRFAEARASLLQAIERAPRLAGSYYEVARCRRVQPEDGELLANMRAALGQPGLDASQQSRVHLALGKAADDLGDPEAAMRHFDAAEELRNRTTRFDLAAFETRVNRLIARCTRESMARAPRLGAPSDAPILIVGLPRSGTTLAEQILSAHPAVAAGGELSFWNERGRAWEHAGAAGPDDAFLAAAAGDYERLLRGMAPNARRVTDKMPLNFQWAGLIHRASPRATIIHCRRDPLDTALSIHQTHFNPRMAFPTGGDALVGYVRAYQRLCAHWRAILPPERFIEIEYESLTATPEPVIRRLLAACGLAWHEACLSPEQNQRVVRTASKWQARQAIHGNSVGRWRGYQPWLGALRALLD